MKEDKTFGKDQNKKIYENDHNYKESPIVSIWQDTIYSTDEQIYPTKEHPHDSGYDLHVQIESFIDKYHEGYYYRNTDSEIRYMILLPGQMKTFHTGTYIKLPENMEAQIRSKSSLSCKKGLCVINQPGTIDPGYDGEIYVTLINHGKTSIKINHGDPIAQITFHKITRTKIQYTKHHYLLLESNYDKMSRGLRSMGESDLPPELKFDRWVD